MDNLIPAFNLITSVALLYPATVLLRAVIHGLKIDEMKRLSIGLIFLFAAFGLFSLLNVVLHIAILFIGVANEQLYILAFQRTFLVNLLLLAAGFILVRVANDK